MAVFTEITGEEASELLAGFDIGSFRALAPIASGIENTNYFLDTDRGRWVLTIFERLAADQLGYYLELCEHLAGKGCRVACPERNRAGSLIGTVRGKPFSIANRLEGEDCRNMGLPECRSMGRLLAKMHLAALDFPLKQENLRGLRWWVATAPLIRPHVPEALYALLIEEVRHQQEIAETQACRSLTVTACHCDLFRNNALISRPGTEEAEVAGVFDFYFAGHSPWLFDLAVTMNDWCSDMETGRFVPEKAQAFIESYNGVRPLTDNERVMWRNMLRAAALRFWTSRLFDFYLPRPAALLKPHDPAEFERILLDRRSCELPWPEKP